MKSDRSRGEVVLVKTLRWKDWLKLRLKASFNYFTKLDCLTTFTFTFQNCKAKQIRGKLNIRGYNPLITKYSMDFYQKTLSNSISFTYSLYLTTITWISLIDMILLWRYNLLRGHAKIIYCRIMFLLVPPNSSISASSKNKSRRTFVSM